MAIALEKQVQCHFLEQQNIDIFVGWFKEENFVVKVLFLALTIQVFKNEFVIEEIFDLLIGCNRLEELLSDHRFVQVH